MMGNYLSIFTLFVGAVGGFLFHAFSMTVSFKQRTIDNKIKVFASLITQWVTMRNFIYGSNMIDQGDALPTDIIDAFDEIYGQAQTFIGETFLVCDNVDLANDANELTERIYRTEWALSTVNNANEEMEKIKSDALKIIDRMKQDIKKGTRFNLSDFKFMICGR